MLDTPPPFMPGAQLAQQPVQELLNHFTTALSSWLSDPYGLVQTGVLKDGKTRFPQLYRQDGSLESQDLYPDQRMKALCFFEREGASEIVWTDQLHKAGEWQHQLAAVVWVNLLAIDSTRSYDFSDELALDFLTRGLLASVDGQAGRLAPGAIEQRAERVFSRYTNWPEKQQLLMYPYAGFRIPFMVRQSYVACGHPFTPASPLPPMAPPVLPQFVMVSMNIPLGTVLGLTEATGAVLYDATLPDDEQALYGIAMTSAPAGQQVKVFQTPGGLLTIPNWGLIPGQTYFAGPNGTLVTTDKGLYFSQILGRAITADSLLYQPEDLTILLQ
jgi:hypothetical protein